VLGAISLSTGVVCEAIATRRMARGVMRRFREQDRAACAPAPAYSEIMQFYTPLAMTSVIGFVVTPMLAFFLGRAPMSVESLAVLPVVDSFVFLFRSFGFSYQEVGIALMGDRRQNLPALRRVGFMISVATTAILLVIAFTPLVTVLYQGIYGLSATMILVPLPALAVLYSLQRAVLISARRNVEVTISTVLEVGLIAVVMAILVATWNPVGAVSAATAMIVGRLVANAYLAARSSRALKAP
jgi:progressive ankylosis protein